MTRVIHWAFVVLIIYSYVQNGEVTGALDSPEAMRTEVYFGLFVLALLLGRYLWVRRDWASALPINAPVWEKRAARAVHLGMYWGLALVILSGFGIALVMDQSETVVEAVSDVHIFFTNLTLLLMIIHVVAAIWHKIHRKDGVMESMTGKLPI